MHRACFFGSLALVVVSLASAAPAQTDEALFSGAMIPIGGSTGSVVLADVNGDGKTDLLGAINPNGALVVMLGDGIGGFGAPANYPVGAHPSALAIGDFFADGTLDVAVALATTETPNVAILRGIGGGAFAALPAASAGAKPAHLVATDRNADGKLDLVVANYASNDVSVLLGNGLGAFASAGNFPAGGSPFHVWVANTDNAMSLDVIAQFDFAHGALLRGDAAGGLGTPAAFTIGGAVSTYGAFQVVDLNGDGVADLVGTNMVGSDGALEVRLGSGAGTFGSSAFYTTGPGTTPQYLTIADLNGDSRPDAVVSSTTGNFIGQISVLLNSGTGAFGPPALKASGFSSFHPSAPYGPIVADVNGDGLVDIVAGNSDYVISVYLGLGAGSFSGPVDEIPGYLSPLGTADLNQDGCADIVGNSVNGSFNVFFGRPSPALGASLKLGWNAISQIQTPVHLVLGDRNGDGMLDAVIANGPIPYVTIVTSLSGGGLGAALKIDPVSTTDAVALGDLNGDGRPDLVVVGSNSTLGPGVTAMMATPTYQYSTPVFTALSADPPATIAIGDFNADGAADVVTGNHGNLYGATISVLLGNGAGGLQAPVSYPSSGIDPTGIAVADMNGDGRLDVVEVNPDNSRVGVHFGSASGNLGATILIGVGPAPSALAVGDVNFDGKPDIVTSSSETGDLSVVAGLGGGAFAGATSLFLGAEKALTVSIADLNGDGIPDLVACDGETNYVRCGHVGGTFSAARLYDTGFIVNVTDLAVGDADGDGKPDLVMSGRMLTYDSVVTTRFNVRRTPTGVASFGSGTPGCMGTQGLNAHGAPKVGNAGFSLIATNAPPSSVGLAVVGNAADVAGSDSLGIGVKLHVDLFASTTLFALNCFSDASGVGAAVAGIPNAPGLAGLAFDAQVVWVWAHAAPCDPSFFGLSSSRGLRYTIQP